MLHFDAVTFKGSIDNTTMSDNRNALLEYAPRVTRVHNFDFLEVEHHDEGRTSVLLFH